MNSRLCRFTCAGLALVCLAAAPVASPEAGLQPFEQFYGIYVNGQKVGWMRSQLQTQPQPIFTTQLTARVMGMGQAQEIELTETRAFEPESGLLERIDFVQKAATGQVQVTGSRAGAKMHLNIVAGGATHGQDLDVDEHLTDALATYRLARAGKNNAVHKGVHFDPSIQKVMRVEHKVVSLQRRIFAGVDTQAVKIVSTYPELNVTETEWFDSAGKVLESRVGGFFVARLEPPEEAKRLDYNQDLLVSAVVRAPHALVAPQSVQSLTLRMKGFESMQPPQSPRQKVTVAGDTTTLVLRKDPSPPRTALSARPVADGAPDAAQVKAALQPTAFIQSDAPKIVEAAKTAVGDTKDVFTASTRLVEFVYKHIHSEYVPAFSNALEAFESARGDCTEHSILFVALARAVGIPARVAVGVAYWPPGDGFGWHAWAEVYVAGRWTAVDPTWNQPIADATHLKLAEGDPAEQARIVMLLGQLKVVEMHT